MSKLVHINKVEITKVDNLSVMRVLSDTKCRFTSEVSFEEICIQELAGVTIEDSYDNNQKVYTTTVSFHTREKQPITDRRIAFRLTSVDGKRYMVGTNTRPFPLIKENNAFPEKPADSSLKAVKVTWKSLLPMLLIVE